MVFVGAARHPAWLNVCMAQLSRACPSCTDRECIGSSVTLDSLWSTAPIYRCGRTNICRRLTRVDRGRACPAPYSITTLFSLQSVAAASSIVFVQRVVAHFRRWLRSNNRRLVLTISAHTNSEKCHISSRGSACSTHPQNIQCSSILQWQISGGCSQPGLAWVPALDTGKHPRCWTF